MFKYQQNWQHFGEAAATRVTQRLDSRHLAPTDAPFMLISNISQNHLVVWSLPFLDMSTPFLQPSLSSQINELSHVQIPIMLMPDDFKAYSKIKVDNHLFNK